MMGVVAMLLLFQLEKQIPALRCGMTENGLYIDLKSALAEGRGGSGGYEQRQHPEADDDGG